MRCLGRFQAVDEDNAIIHFLDFRYLEASFEIKLDIIYQDKEGVGGRRGIENECLLPAVDPCHRLEGEHRAVFQEGSLPVLVGDLHFRQGTVGKHEPYGGQGVLVDVGAPFQERLRVLYLHNLARVGVAALLRPGLYGTPGYPFAEHAGRVGGSESYLVLAGFCFFLYHFC